MIGGSSAAHPREVEPEMVARRALQLLGVVRCLANVVTRGLRSACALPSRRAASTSRGRRRSRSRRRRRARASGSVRSSSSLPVGDDHLDHDVEPAGRDDDVVGLGPVCDLVRDVSGRTRRLHADERLLEAEPERVRDGDHLEDLVAPSAARSERARSPPRRRDGRRSRRNDSRPFSWSASMIPRSSSSTRRAGATGPRRWPGRVASRSGWASSLRNARHSYHPTAHFVNPGLHQRRFARESVGESQPE